MPGLYNPLLELTASKCHRDSFHEDGENSNVVDLSGYAECGDREGTDKHVWDKTQANIQSRRRRGVQTERERELRHSVRRMRKGDSTRGAWPRAV